jgi:CheY-like chemotaxis protein
MTHCHVASWRVGRRGLNRGCSMFASKPHDRPDHGASNLDGLRVLVVEDAWPVASAVKRFLQICGADVSGPVATTADAVRLISERTIDVALVDIALRGGETAYELIDQLHTRGVRTVVVTGYAEVSSLQGKVAIVLSKPVGSDVLVQSLRSAALGA